MKRNWINLKISKDLLKRKYFLKKLLKIIILKSLIRNQNCLPVIRAYSYLKINNTSKIKYKITTQQNRCLLTGKAKTTFKFSGLSRQSSKFLIDVGLLQNIKSYSY